MRQELTNADKAFEGIKGRSKESALPPGYAAAWSGAAWEISFMRGRKEAAADSQLLSIKTVHGLHLMFLSGAAPPDCWCARLCGRWERNKQPFFLRLDSKFMSEQTHLRASLDSRFEGSQHVRVTETDAYKFRNTAFLFFFLERANDEAEKCFCLSAFHPDYNKNSEVAAKLKVLAEEHAKTPSMSPHFLFIPRWSSSQRSQTDTSVSIPANDDE